nr:xanthine dehydrogenase molybdopterin binding subunit [uncultured Cohaesibacter sp.]
MKQDINERELIDGAVHLDRQHESAHKHVTGKADFTDDEREPIGTLHACLGLSEKAHARIIDMDLSACLVMEGVVGVLTSKDIVAPGHNDISANHLDDEPVFPQGEVQFLGQPLFAVVAKTREQARKAVKAARIAYDPLTAQIDAFEAMEAGYPYVAKPLTLERGDVTEGFAKAPNRIRGQIRIGGQDHMYLEGQIAFAIPGEDDDMLIRTSTQHPSEAQHMVSQVLGIPSHAVTVQVRRLGGGFGGKESQMSLFCAVAALGARKFGAPVKIRPDRDDDMMATGKRHDFVVDYKVGFDDEGAIVAVESDFVARCGFAADLSGAVTDRALFHADNAYFYPNVLLRSHPMKTNTVSNTAFRGFGGPQGVVVAERMIEEIAFSLGKDPLEVRKANFYGEPGRDITPYHQQVEDNILPRLIAEMEMKADYQARRAAILAFNEKANRYGGLERKGLALTPVKFGISFTATHFNQAGSLIHIYSDGSIQLNHGGTEMGQGLNTKVAQIVADALSVDIDRIKITRTATDKVPNTSATAASSGSDLNGMAALDAANQLKGRLIAFICEKWGVRQESIRFLPNRVQIGEELLSFDELIKQAYLARVHLSAAGFYKTPKIHWDRDKGKGRPFFYFAYGAAVSEVTVNRLTGEYVIERTDILHDVGKSLNPVLDRGQVEGAFVQGMGWLTTEELWWDGEGRLKTHAPSTYKIPLASDIPRIFNVELAQWSENAERTIKRSKAVGEPPFMLAVSVLEALSMAVASVADYKICPRLETPATPERVLMAIEALLSNGAKDG